MMKKFDQTNDQRSDLIEKIERSSSTSDIKHSTTTPFVNDVFFVCDSIDQVPKRYVTLVKVKFRIMNYIIL